MTWKRVWRCPAGIQRQLPQAEATESGGEGGDCGGCYVTFKPQGQGPHFKVKAAINTAYILMQFCGSLSRSSTPNCMVIERPQTVCTVTASPAISFL
jgi:hypothetical protein